MLIVMTNEEEDTVEKAIEIIQDANPNEDFTDGMCLAIICNEFVDDYIEDDNEGNR